MPRQRCQLPRDDPPARKRRPHRLPWWIAILVLASACSRTDDAAPSASTPSGTTASSSVSVAPSQPVNFQMRQVKKIVSPSSADWSKTRLTCSVQGEDLSDCVASTLDAARIVLFRPEQGSQKYILGPVIVDGTDVERASAQLEQQSDLGWSVSIGLTTEAAEAFRRLRRWLLVPSIPRTRSQSSSMAASCPRRECLNRSRTASSLSRAGSPRRI
jgi:hypothetical protein